MNDKCPVCGEPVKVAGGETKYYESTAAKTIKELQDIADNQKLIIRGLLEPAEKVTGKEGSTAVLVYISRLEQQTQELQAQVEDLQDTNEHLLKSNDDLNTQLEVLGVKERPSYLQSLSAIRNEAIEECAVLADANFNKVYDGDYLYEIDIANAIRNLKAGPQLTEEE